MKLELRVVKKLIQHASGAMIEVNLASTERKNCFPNYHDIRDSQCWGTIGQVPPPFP